MIRCAFKQVCAVWLAVLTLSPLTAPFPTCDLATWLEGTLVRINDHRPRGRADSSPAAQADTAAAPLLCRAAVARRVRLAPSSPWISLKFSAAPLAVLSARVVAARDTTPPPASAPILRV